MAVFSKITKAAQDVVRGAKDITDTARQNSLIAGEQKQILNLFLQIGKLYHETQKIDPDTPLGKLCLAINASNERIATYNNEIRKIKGTTRCPSCGADIPITSSFCGVCGANTDGICEISPSVETSDNYCTNCKAQLDEELAFCPLCGQKQNKEK